jgi:xanthine/uracil permease
MAKKSTNTKYKGIILVIAAALLVIIVDMQYFHGQFIARLAFNIGVAICMIIIYYKIIVGSKRTSN